MTATANFDNISVLATKDWVTARDMKVHADEWLHRMQLCWAIIETNVKESGYDIFDAFTIPQVKASCLELRWVLLKCLGSEQMTFRHGWAEAQFLEGRGETYGDSWKKRGGVGAFMMLCRKWDRIDNMSQNDNLRLKACIAENRGDVADDIDDLRRYLLLVEDEVQQRAATPNPIDDLNAMFAEQAPKIQFAHTPTFADRILGMNQMYKLLISDYPTCPSDLTQRLTNFKKILGDEVKEIDEIIEDATVGMTDLGILVKFADLLGDIVVYCRSEALKYGIPLELVLDIIMDSNESKLGADGEPIYDDTGKFLKGPNYWKPEPKIKELLVSLGA